MLREFVRRSLFGMGVGRASVKEIGRCLHRDPLITTRLYSAHAAGRDPNQETTLRKQLRQESLRKPDIRLAIPVFRKTADKPVQFCAATGSH